MEYPPQNPVRTSGREAFLELAEDSHKPENILERHLDICYK